MKIDKKNYVILFLYILILRYHYSLMLLSLTSRSRWHRRAWLRHFSTQCDSTVSIPLRSFFTSPLNRIIFIFGNTFSLWIRRPEGLESILFFFQFIRKFFLITKNLLKGAFQPRRWFGKILFSSVIMKHEFRIVYDFCFSSLRILTRSRWWWWRSCDRAVASCYLPIYSYQRIHPSRLCQRDNQLCLSPYCICCRYVSIVFCCRVADPWHFVWILFRLFTDSKNILVKKYLNLNNKVHF